MRRKPYTLFKSISKKTKGDVRRECTRTLAAAVYMLVVIFIMTILQVISDSRYDMGIQMYGATDKSLRDLFFEYIPTIDSFYLVDLSLNSSALFAYLCNLYFVPGWRAKLIYTRRIMWITGTLYGLRGISILITTVPPTLGSKCVRVDTTNAGVLDYIKHAYLVLRDKRNNCTDNIFSGHTVVAVTSFMLWWLYSPYTGFILYSILHTSITLFLIVSSRLHYSVDVYLAIFMTLGAYYAYFYALDQKHNSLMFSHLYSERPSEPRDTLVRFGASDATNTTAMAIPVTTTTTSTVAAGYIRVSITDDAEKGVNAANSCNDLLSRHFALKNNHLFFIQRHFSPKIFSDVVGWADGVDLRLNEFSLPK